MNLRIIGVSSKNIAILDEGRNETTMTIRIGFVGDGGSIELGEAVRELVPPGTSLEILTIAEATRLVALGELTVLIVALEGPSWRDTLDRMMDISVVGEAHPLAVFGLVPRDDPAALVKAFELHVADVASLPIDPHEVRARLAALIRRRQVAFAKAAETRAAWRMAVIDPVTGLYNRHHLDTTLPAAIDSARALGRPLALLMIDLDALKPLNDRWGHAAGDRILRTVAESLQSSARVTDTIARYGGDEIVVVMPDTDLGTARALAAGLVRVVSETRIGRIDDGPTGVTVSIGMATLEDRDMDARALLTRADDALYEAKRAGRNRVAEAA
jgi:two-component system cell cycle response regulator